MRKAYCVLLAAYLFVCLSGCTVNLKDKGALVLEFGSHLKLGHESSATKSTASTNLRIDKTLMEWFLKDEQVAESEPPETSD